MAPLHPASSSLDSLAAMFRLVLAEMITHPLVSPPVSPHRPSCLGDSLSLYLARHPGKRKRSITHFDGIPLAILGPGSAAPSSASYPTATPRESERAIRGPRRVRCLSDYFAGLDVKKRVRFEEDFAAQDQLDEARTAPVSSPRYGKQGLDASPSSETESEELDSDDEDDWRILV